MAIKIVGKKVVEYRITCTDEECLNIIEFDSSDCEWITRSSMGRDAGRAYGISCPDCRQVLPVKDATEIGGRFP